MSTFAVDSLRQPMTATGIVEAVMEWAQTPDGKRRPSDTQARDEQTGMPLWGVEVLYVQSSFGRSSTVTTKVTVAAETEPRPAPLTPIGFSGLVVEARVNKAGGWVESWSAESITEPTRSAGKSAGGGGDRTQGEKAA